MDFIEKVLFVCTANICRSPMAAAIFNALAEDEAITVRAESAGVAALSGKSIAPNAEAALREIGVPCEDHRARQVDETLIGEADLVLTMGPRHTAELHRLSGEFSTKIYTLPEYVAGAPSNEKIPDPYGSTMIAYRASAQQLLEFVSLVVKSLER